jgi:hypothetical protein
MLSRRRRLAQRDLSEFFDGLATDNQLLYTCHSPFLVDADRLDRARKVYVGTDGTSKVTADLRAADGDVAQRGAAYGPRGGRAERGRKPAARLRSGCRRGSIRPALLDRHQDAAYRGGPAEAWTRTGVSSCGRDEGC